MTLLAASIVTVHAPLPVHAATSPAAAKSPPGVLGVSYFAWKGQYADAPKRIATYKDLGFQVVSFIPTYAYVGHNKIDLATGPDAAELAQAMEIALRSGLGVVLKPHLDPPAYGPGFDQFGRPSGCRAGP